MGGVEAKEGVGAGIVKYDEDSLNVLSVETTYFWCSTNKCSWPYVFWSTLHACLGALGGKAWI